MATVLHTRLPYSPRSDPAMRRLPGIQPADPDDAFQPDEAYAAQMAERDRLLGERPDDVLAMRPEAAAAARELLDVALARAADLPGFSVDSKVVTRPDGVRLAIERDAPLATLGHLFQEDFCLLERADGQTEHRLAGAVLCFPAGWTLAEKIGRPLIGIHAPVAVYDRDVAKRVQRLFDALQPGRALWRANLLHYAAPELHQPRREADPHPKRTGSEPFLRSERQVLFRLPETGVVVFSIHTFVLRAEAQSAGP